MRGKRGIRYLKEVTWWDRVKAVGFRVRDYLTARALIEELDRDRNFGITYECDEPWFINGDH